MIKICEISGPDSSIPYPVNGDGGRERVIEWLSKDLSKVSDLYLLAQKDSQLDNVKILEVSHSDGLNAKEFYKNFSESMTVIECDILHVHHPEYLIFSNHIKATQIILTHHGYFQNMDKYRAKYDFEETYVSKYLKSVMSDKGKGFTIYNPIPISEYPFSEDIYSKKDLLFIGSCDKKVKRLDIALEVARRLKCKLIIGGTASMELQKKLMSIAYVDYQGEVNQEKKLFLMRNVKAVICPSDSPEAFCLVAAESNVLGTPVLCSNKGGLPEVVENKISGYICKTIDEYVNAFAKLDNLVYEKIRASACNRFDSSMISLEYLKLFKLLIKEKSEI
jgi:glycosyltransferase involved in cell wall biosynthesis